MFANADCDARHSLVAWQLRFSVNWCTNCLFIYSSVWFSSMFFRIPDVFVNSYKLLKILVRIHSVTVVVNIRKLTNSAHSSIGKKGHSAGDVTTANSAYSDVFVIL